jgi:hypothetical protein
MPPNNEAQGTASVADLIGFPCINQYGEIYDTWKVSRESKSHSTPAGGVPRYALPFLAKVVDRSDKSLGVCSVVLRHIPRYYLMIRSTEQTLSSSRLSVLFSSQRKFADRSRTHR